MSIELIKKIEVILTKPYSDQNYLMLVQDVFHKITFFSPITYKKEYSNFSSHIECSSHIATYIDPNNNKIGVFAVQLLNKSYVENSRSTQRSFAKKLLENAGFDAAFIAFYTQGNPKWRISFVRLDYEFKVEKGRLKAVANMTPARRYSYLVGLDEPCHTAIDRFRNFIINEAPITIDELEEAFSVEAVTDEFFALYCTKFHQLREHLDNNENFKYESDFHNFTSTQFAKKLMGQIVFLYFLQKKGWLGVKALPNTMTEKEYKNAFYSGGSKSRELVPLVYQLGQDSLYHLSVKRLNMLSSNDEIKLAQCVKGLPWGTGPSDFMRRLFNVAVEQKKNFFDDYLEPLFYDALNNNHRINGYHPALHCRIPFLSGGLFEPLAGYQWQDNNFDIPNYIFSNKAENNREADGILDIFDRYNFTMSEDEPMDHEVAIDPEMLGKVFENLLEINDRKSKGAFYTPRNIVHYMCQESLIYYLCNKLSVSEEAIRDFITYGDFMKDEDTDKERRLKNGGMFISEELFLLDKSGNIIINKLPELDKALTEVRIVDPAVGSGAFPLGMLNEIVRARRNISAYYSITMLAKGKKNYNAIRLMYFERSPYKLKYDTIRNCIFGADIDPSAVDIAQLRLWLSLVIDDEINPDAKDPLDGHKVPIPLPNLECNILCGNSLVDSFEGIELINASDIIFTSKDIQQQSLSMNGFNQFLPQLIEAQEKLYKCQNTEEKKKILEDISSYREMIISNQLDGCSQEILSRYELSKQAASKPYILWQLDFAKVFQEKEGFDIIIGNPPYIQLQKRISENSNEKLGDLYSNLGFKTFTKTGDIYCLFYEKGYNLLHNNGILTYITSNKWMRAGYGSNLRSFFTQSTDPKLIVDFAGTKVFKSATVDVNILLLTKANNSGKTKACTLSVNSSLESISSYVAKHSSIMSFAGAKSWSILSPIEQSILHKIESSGVPLKKWNISIKRGIVTGCNEAFIISGEQKEEILKNDPRSAELIRPILRGRDVKRYEYIFPNLWLINVHNGIKEKGIKPINIDDYPAIKDHLNCYYNTLKKRTDKGDTPYNLRNCVYMDDFSKPKIVYREISDEMNACYIESEYMLNNKCYMITGEHLIYILSYLNSKLFSRIVLPQANITGGKGEAFLGEVFLVFPSKEIEERICKLYEMRENTANNIDQTIDSIFCELFGLTENERNYIIS